MGFLDFLKVPDINQGIQTFQQTAGAVLLDVRTPSEYKEGHIPGSKNIPLQNIDRVTSMIHEKGTPLFVYCYSGSRSRQASHQLEKMGYTNVNNSGGIASYSGKVVR